MAKCAERPSFAEAFGKDHAERVADFVKANMGSSLGGGGGMKMPWQQ
jgi:hypothetical protein